MQGRIAKFSAAADMSAENNVGSSGKKTKDRIQQLSELRRGLIHYTDAQYGTANDALFVIHVTVDGVVSMCWCLESFEVERFVSFSVVGFSQCFLY